MITCSGTEPAIIAAMLKSIRVSATIDDADAAAEQRDAEPGGGTCLAPRDAKRRASGRRGSLPAGARRA